ncbi:hypothetical protein [Yoonia sp. I 8.24]|uniref:hypothetical protein n=1 Tax=Yoonia sp. I 8.24 TaxID=1537229 RepID=UPI001EDD9E44|nr:hypothetical protein [Yoonia sp. I 8.24]MCG3267161.1 hypothetical protein [Yoonia sp. I 8.24]
MSYFKQLFFVMLLSSCSFFAPAYVEEADTRATEAYETLSNILAKAELGELSDPETFAASVDSYALIISKLETAAFSVGGTPTEETSQPRDEAQSSLNAVIQSCLTLVKLFASEHETDGIVVGSGTTQPVRISCDQAVKAIRARR